ncbi:MAG: hypothetical protein ABI451_07850, partial [Dokdonella sp.]
ACSPASGSGLPTSQFDLTAGASATITLSGTIDPNFPYYVIDAYVTNPGGNPDPYPGDNTAHLNMPSSFDGIFHNDFE